MNVIKLLAITADCEVYMVKEISLVKLFKAIVSKIWFVVALALLLGAGANIYASVTTTPTYRSEALLYIYNNDRGNTSGQMSQTNMMASEQVLYRYVVLIDKADVIYEIALERLEELQDNCAAGVEGYEQYRFLLKYKFSPGMIKNMISVGQNMQTEILSIYATASDPKLAQIVAHTVTTVLQTEIPRLLDASSNYYVNEATFPTSASSPVRKYTIIGLVSGAALACFLIFLALLFDVAIRSEADLEEQFPSIPVIGVVPDMDSIREKGTGLIHKNTDLE